MIFILLIFCIRASFIEQVISEAGYHHQTFYNNGMRLFAAIDIPASVDFKAGGRAIPAAGNV